MTSGWTEGQSEAWTYGHIGRSPLCGQQPTKLATTRSAGPTVIGLPVRLTVVHFSLVKSPQNQGGLKRPGGTKAVWDAWDSNPELIS